MSAKNSGLQPGGYIAIGVLAFLIGMAIGAGGSTAVGAVVCIAGVAMVLIGVIALGVRAGRG